MRTQPSTTPPSALLLLLAALVCLVPGGLSAQQPPTDDPDALAEELWQRLDLLVASVLELDDAGLDDALCLQDLLPPRLSREETLGLVPDAQDPTLVAERTAQLRDDARKYVTNLLDRGRQITAIDIGRLRGDDQENLQATGDEPGAAITGSGLLGVEMLELRRDVDLSLLQVGGRWCFDPFTLTPPR